MWLQDYLKGYKNLYLKKISSVKLTLNGLSKYLVNFSFENLP